MERSSVWLSIALQTALLGVFLWMVAGLLTPVALGAIFALLLHPLQKKLSRRLGARAAWSPLLVTVAAIFLGVLPVALISAKAVVSINSFLATDWTASLEAVRVFFAEKLEGYARDSNFGDIGTTIENLVRQLGSSIAGSLGSFALGLPAQLLDLFLFVLSLYYFLRDGRALARWLLRLLPFSHDATEELFQSIHETVNGAILGTIATAVVQGALTIGALYLFRVPGAFLFGVLATFLAVIPMVGTTPITFGAVIYLVAVGRTGAAIGMGVAAIIIGISDNIVRPWVQSSQSHMHPLLVLLALFGGVEAFGAFGVFIGPVIAAVALWTVDTYAELRLKHSSREGPPSSTSMPGL